MSFVLYSEKIPPRPHTNSYEEYGKVYNNIVVDIWL